MKRGFGPRIAAAVVTTASAATRCYDGLAQSGATVVKLGEERIAYQEGDPALDPHVLVAANGNIGFAYSNLNARQYALIRYRMAPEFAAIATQVAKDLRLGL